MDTRCPPAIDSDSGDLNRRRARLIAEYASFSLMVVLALAAGCWAAGRRAAALDDALRADLRGQAVAIARAVSPDLATRLSFTPEDEGDPAFERLREQFAGYARLLKVRGIYTLAQRDSHLVFGPESYEANDPMASPPGTPFLNPRENEFAILRDGKPYVTGPETDEYGTFVSALAAVRDPDTGRVIMAVGLDVTADDWSASLSAARRPLYFATGMAILLLAGGGALLRWRRKVPPRTRARYAQLESVLALVYALALTGILTAWVHESEMNLRRARFNNLADAHIELVHNDLLDARRSLESLVNFFEASSYVDPEEFRAFSEPLLRFSGGIRALAWMPLITETEIGAYHAYTGEAGLFDLTDDLQRVAAAPRSVHLPVRYIEPRQLYGHLAGLDMAGRPGCVNAISRAIQTGMPDVTGFMEAQPDTGSDHSFWLYLPVHRHRLSERTASDDDLRTDGVVAALINPETALRRTLRIGAVQSPEAHVSLLGLRQDGGISRLASHPPMKTAALDDAQHEALLTRPVFAMGLPMALAASRCSSYREPFAISPAHIAGGSGLLISLALAAIVAQIRRRESMLAALVEQRTRELTESETLYSGIFHAMSAGSALHDIICDENGKPCDYRFLQVNPAFERLTGMKADQLVGRTVREALPGTEDFWIETYGRVALTGESEFFEHYSEVLNRYYEVTAYSPRHGQFAVIFMDVTERKMEAERRVEFDRRMQETQRLESLGVLAGGIAHDFNNILMAILGYADLAQQELSPVSPAVDCILELEKAARRAGELCKQMLAYSGKGHFVIRRFVINEIVEEMLHLLRHSISKQAVLNLHLAHNLPPIEGDATQIRQVVMNLVINASDALDDKSGSISISTGAMHYSRKYLYDTFGQMDLEPGLYITLEVSDTGCGIAPENIKRIFDPFYTTKFTGRGLGLAAVLGIVRGHKGAIKVYSEPGKGTAFKALLPALDGEFVGAEAPPEKAAQHAPARGGLILLVDDEETNRALGERMLSKMGYQVALAADGIEALDVYRTRGAEIVCVILDLTMPHMNGEDTFRALRDINPELRVVLTSGYSREELSERYGVKGFAAFLEKPYTTADLVAVLNKALGAKG